MNDIPEEPADLSGLEVKDFAAQRQSAEAEQASKAILAAVSELKAENADLREKNLRIIAEMENFRRRAERDKTEGVKYAASGFARDMISVADNLRRAIEASSKDASDPAVKTFLEGVEATERELFKGFEKHGLTRFDPLGEKFDPHKHEAVVKVDVPNVPADTIVQVLQAGYQMNDRVLRPATVILAKGSAQSKAASPGQGGGGDGEPDGNARAHGADPASDPDVQAASGEPHGIRKDRPGDKRASTVTKPVTGGSSSQKDDLASSFGRRLENGS